MVDIGKRNVLKAAALAAAGTAAGCAAIGPEPSRREPAAKRALSLGTSPPGGGFTVYGAAFAATVNELELSLEIQPVNTKGSTDNIPLLEQGKLALGLVGGEPAFEALSGVGRPPAALRIVSPMYSSAGMFVVRGDGNIRSISDLKGKPVVFGARGSGLIVLARYVLDGMGLDMDRDFQASYLDRSDIGVTMVQDGRAAALWGGGIGWPGFTAMAKSPSGARFVVPDETEATRILGKHSFLKRLSVPASTYPGQNAPIHSVGTWSVVMARADLDESVAYSLARAVHKGEAAITARVPSGVETRAANTLVAAPRSEYVHPGVLRYLREQGISR
jgi:TRAP transporter TAXI family solute receptor